MNDDQQRKELAAKIGVCGAFLAKTIGKGTIQNQVKYLLTDFFYDEGWASMTNPKEMKDGYNASHTYNNTQIDHFIEDFTRWIEHEWEVSFLKAVEEAQPKQQPKVTT